jgi:hypothetical protein
MLRRRQIIAGLSAAALLGAGWRERRMLQKISGHWVGLSSPLIRVGVEIDPSNLRGALIEEIFSGAGLPSSGSDRITAAVTDPLVALGVNSANTARVDYHELDIMNNAPAKIGTTEFWVFRPTSGNNRLAVLLLGHNTSISVNTGSMAHDLIDAGYTVALGHFFPNLDASGTPGYNTTTTHDALPSPTSTLNPIRYFVQGPVRIVNELEGEGFDFVFGVGQSGGGWEMVLWGAIDTRTAATCSHAGYWALYMDETGGRDWEQTLPLHGRSLSDLANIDYTDLAALACHPSRTHSQSTNDQDPVFAKLYYDAEAPYEDIVRNVAAKSGGHYDLQFDVNNQHTYLASRRAAIVALFDSLAAHPVS